VSGPREKHAEILSNRGGEVAIGYQLELEKASRCGNCGQILKIWARNKPAKYNRYVITDPTSFQDHRHRPLGHPSAVKNPARIPRRIICGFQLLAVIDESPGAQHRHLHGDQELVVAAFQAVQRSPLHGGDARLRPSRPRYPTKLTHHS
jgi:ribosomal protein L34E